MGPGDFYQVTVELLAEAAVIERLDSTWRIFFQDDVLTQPWAPRLVDLSIRLLECPYEVSADFLHIKSYKREITKRKL